MSYSFGVKADSKAEAIAKADEEMDKVVAGQPTHAKDRGAAMAAVEAFVNMLVDPNENEQISLTVSGSLGWRAEGEYTNSNVYVQSYISPKV